MEAVAEDGDGEDRGVRPLLGERDGVAAGDGAGALPVAQELDGFDYWEVHPARGAIARIHVEWREKCSTRTGFQTG